MKEVNMANIPTKIETWQMVEPGKLNRTSIPVPELKPGEALVEIAGCGVCHTDISYFYMGVPTVNKPPLTLGHEISGKVIAGDSKFLGKEVIVPAVMPCNNCPICAAGRGNRCLAQKMPGNSLGIYGGFSSHIVVPSQDLCVVPDRGDFKLSDLAVVADAVTSPYQGAMRAEVKPGDNVIIVGITGGLGVYASQICRAMGAKEVVGTGRNPAKLERAMQYGATKVINTTGKDIKAIRDEFRAYCKEKGLPSNYGWKIFEWTGTAEGQTIALELLSFIGVLVIAGFGMQKNEYSMSRLMAYDADVKGTWGCLPKYYPPVLQMVLEKKIAIKPFMESRPMSQIQKALEDAHGSLDKRIVLLPDF
jgi:6-hydroxycyclohex-1-ene-1-carbonyl-CoA dehydrogenase